MKKIFVALLLLTGFYGFGQSVGRLRYDTVVIEKIGGNAELVIRNSTKDTLGFLYNFGNGRTGFKTIPASSGSGGLTGARNLGTAFRIFLPDSSGWKTLANGYAVLIDSATAKTLTFKVDTTLIQKLMSGGGALIKNNNQFYFKNDTLVCDTCVFAYKDGRPGTYPSYVLDTTGISLIVAGSAYLRMIGTKRIGVAALSSGVIVGTTPVTSGTAQRILYEGSTNKVAETANFEFDGTSVLNIPATGSYKIGALQFGFIPNQTNFGKTFYVGNMSTGGSALDHSGGGITGGYNVFVGQTSGNACTSCNANTAVGAEALKALTTGTFNIAIGADAHFALTTGSNNIAIGKGAQQNGTAQSQTVSVGRDAHLAETGTFSTAVGDQAGHDNTSADNNTLLGAQTGYFNVTGDNNTYVGTFSGVGASTFSNSNNTTLGYKALFTNNTGNGNIAIGDSANYTATAPLRTIVIGTNLLDFGNFSSNIGGTLAMTGQTGTGTTMAGNVGILISTPREVLDVNGQVSIRTVNAGTSVDSITAMENGRVTSIDATAWGRIASTGLTNTSGTWTNDRVTGKAGGGTVVGGTAANDILILRGTLSSSGNTGTNSNMNGIVGDGAGTTAWAALNNGTFQARYLTGTTAIGSVTAGTGAGTGPTVSATGTDLGGYISVTTGTSPTAAATVVTVNFGNTQPSAPRCVQLTPGNAATAALSGVTMAYADQANITTGVFVITAGPTNLTAATAYKWYYTVIN